MSLIIFKGNSSWWFLLWESFVPSRII